MIRTVSFDRFRRAIAALPVKPKYEKSDLLRDEFLLFREGTLDVYYAPFHRLNPAARVVLVGLTPGWTQMELAYRTARECLDLRLSDRETFERIELAGSFGGSLRINLVKMLDGIGLHICLNIESCGALFDISSRLAHFTSAVSVPVFRGTANYTGYGSPSIFELPQISVFISENLAPELAALPQALIVPLGSVTQDVIEHLRQSGSVQAERCLSGFPHPSGANGHRMALYLEGRERWSAQLRDWFHR